MPTMSDFPHPLPQVFIETGFGKGGTLNYAVQHDFEEIHSIEIDPDLFEEGSLRFRSHPNVSLHCGDSRHVLSHIITPSKSTLFWLDAHWSGGGYGELKPEDQCPLMGELAAITAVKWREEPLIVIDDSTFFTGQWWEIYGNSTPYLPELWPTLDEIRDALPDYEVTEYAGVLVCVPPDCRRALTVAGRVFGADLG